MDFPDPSLVEQVIEKNERACARLLDRIEGLVRAAVRQGGYVISAADEEVLREELRVQVLFSLSRWDRERGSFTVWLYGIARNLLNSHLRARSRRIPCVPLDPGRHAAVGAQSDPTEPTTATSSPLVELFWDTVVRMSREDQIVVDHLLDGAPHRQLAARLGVSEAAAKMRAYRVRGRLRERLTERWPRSSGDAARSRAEPAGTRGHRAANRSAG